MFGPAAAELEPGARNAIEVCLGAVSSADPAMAAGALRLSCALIDAPLAPELESHFVAVAVTA